MGLFVSGLAGTDYRRKAALAALDLATSVPDVPLDVAANAGIAFVGNVGSGAVRDFTALGDAVNVGAPSEIVKLRGRSEPVEVNVVRI